VTIEQVGSSLGEMLEEQEPGSGAHWGLLVTGEEKKGYKKADY